MMASYTPRDNVVSYLRSVLYGPTGGDDEVLRGTPFLRYMTGILFPVGGQVESVADAVTASADEQAAAPEAGDEATGDQGSAVALSSEALPSAVGISFKVSDDASVSCAVWGGRYEQVEAPATGTKRGSVVWKRHPLFSEALPEVVVLNRDSQEVPVFGGRARLVPRWRTVAGGHAIVTIALVNCQPGSGRGADPALSLFQVGLRCEADSGVLPYPQVGTSHDDDSEEAEVEFLYRAVQPFARGHGAAANWSNPVDGTSAWVAVDFVPSVDVPKATFELSAPGVSTRCCELAFLVSASRAEVV